MTDSRNQSGGKALYRQLGVTPGAPGAAAWGAIGGALSSQADLVAALTQYLLVNGSRTGTGTQRWELTSTGGGLEISANAGVIADQRWMSGGNARWIARKNTDSEAVAQNGGNFEFLSRNDDGSARATIYTINRNTGVFNYTLAPTIGGYTLYSIYRPFAIATGSANVVNVDFTPDLVLVDGFECSVRAAYANTSTVLIQVDSATSLDLTKFGNQSLVAGDIYGAGHELRLRYVTGSPNRWELLNPAQSADGVIVTDATTARTASLADAKQAIKFTNSSAINFTVPPFASVPLPLGTVLYAIQGATGQVTLVPGAGVTLLTPDSLKTRAQESIIGVKHGPTTNTWEAFGDLESVLSAASVIGRAGNTSGPGATISSGADAQTIIRRAGVLVWADLRLVAGSTTADGWIAYSGTTQATGTFDGGTTAPSHASRLNYDGYFYATRFYGDGSNLSAIPLTALSQTSATTGQVPTWNGSAWVATTPAASGQVAIQFKDEGSNVGSSGAITSVDFVGSSVTASVVGTVLTVTIAGGGSGDSVTKTYIQSAHGFLEGMPVYLGSSIWAQADRDFIATIADGVVSALSSPVTADSNWANVVSVLNFTGANNTTVFTDPLRTWTPQGNVKIDTSLGYNVGLFDGTTDALTSTGTNLALSNVYTIEAYVAKSSAGGLDSIFAQISGAYDGCQFRLSPTGIDFNTYNGGGATNFARTYTTDTAEHHIAVSCNGTNLWAYKDGVLLGSAAASQTIGPSTGTLNIGQDWSGTSSDLGGTMRGFRITKACRYPNGTTFTPPSLPLPEQAASSYAGFTLTQVGLVTLTTAQWDARTGDTGGLTVGADYWLSSTTGGLTKTKPTSGLIQHIGRGESNTVMRVAISPATYDPVTSSYTQTSHGFTEGMPIYRGATQWAQTDRDSPTTPCDAIVSSTTAATTIYATLNPSDKSANLTLSGGNLIATRGAAAAAWSSVRSTIPFIGKVYVEVTSGFANATDGMDTGFGLSSVSTGTYPGAVANSYGVVKGTSGGNATAYSAGGGGVNYAQNACGVGDVARLCIDVPAGKAWYQQAGSANWHGGGDPVTGTTPTFTFTPGSVMYFMLALYQSGNTATVNFGASAFTYSVPAGFQSGLFTTTSNVFTATQAGLVTLTVAQWYAVTGEVIGLTEGSIYYTSSTPGGLTKTKPTSGICQIVGRAESATTMRVIIGDIMSAMGGTTVAGLPSAAIMGFGFLAMVTDALTPVSGSTVVGGGSVKKLVFSDTTNWIVV